MYKLKSLALLAGLVGMFALVAHSLFGWLGALLVLVLGLVVNWISLDRAAGLILRLHRARPLSAWEAPQLQRMVRELAGRAEIPAPELMVYPAEMPNAFALGAGGGVVAVSSALLQLLSAREIRGVLAHEFAHLKNRDSALSLSAGIFVQAITALSQVFGLTLLLLVLTGAWAALGPGVWPVMLLVALAPSASVLLQAGLMRTRERLADRDAAALSGDPRGLASALHKLQQYSRYMQRWLRRFRFIYTSEEERGHSLLRTHPPTAERVQALLALEHKTTARPVLARPGHRYGHVYSRLAG